MQITLAIVLGLLFGFTLQRTGAANPVKIIDMLRFRDLHLMKAILLGIGLAGGGLFLLLHYGIVDVVSHLSVKSAYVGVIIGGLLLGIGWGMCGICPGTGVVALGAGRRDAWFFLLGGLPGAFAFTLLYGTLKESFLFAGLGGKVTVAATGSDKYAALFPDISGIALAGGMALGFIVVAFLLPLRKIRRLPEEVEAEQ